VAGGSCDDLRVSTARRDTGTVIELIPGEHYLVLFAAPGELPDNETIEELRILAYARRRRDTLGPGLETAIATLAQAVSADILPGSVWMRCQAAVSYVRNYRARPAPPAAVSSEQVAVAALEAIRAAQAPVPVPVPVPAAFSRVDVSVPHGGYHLTVQSHGSPVNVIVDEAHRLVDVIIGAPERIGGIARNQDTELTAESTEVDTGRVFISYVGEDIDHVEDLCDILAEADIAVWRDTADLWPGEDRRARIRMEITVNTLVFLACFSCHSVGKYKSSQREELNLAIAQLQLRSPAQPWLIPVRFDDCQIPELELGGQRTLGQLQRVDLFGDDYSSNAERLTTMIRRILRSTEDQGQAGLGLFTESDVAHTDTYGSARYAI
jgi:hypothetical protein